MTIEERYELSCYEEITKLHETKDVWLVRHNETGMLYVKKRVQLYNREVYHQIRMHPMEHIPHIMLCVEDESGMIVVEEYIHGMSLEKMLLEHGTFSEQQVLEIMLKLCAILEELHTHTPPIVHRDIKPSNIMMSRDGSVKLIDFNAAKEYTQGQTEDTHLMGTRKFAAPEQYGFGQSDSRTDIYAMGVTMYYLLTKQFPESNLYHGKLLPVIQTCMELDKSNRYQNVRMLALALQSAMQEERQTTYPKRMIGSTEKPKTSYLPIGFRSGVMWKMIVAVIGYAMLFHFCLTLEIKDAEGVLMTGYAMWLNRIAILLFFLGVIFFIGNYANIRYRLPGMRKTKALHIFLSVVYLMIYFLLIIILLVLLGGNG